jgi:Flp pilus assembly protein TadD
VSSTAGCQLPAKHAHSRYRPTQLLQQTGEAVSDALRIEPKVAKAADPTSLDFTSGPVKPGLHLSAAAVMEQNGQLDEARRHYEEVLKADPTNRTALVGLARLHHRQGNLEAAITAYRRAAGTLANDPVVLNDLALCLARANRHDEAIAQLRTAVALKPDSLMYRNNLAAVLIQAHRADEAVGVLAEQHGLAVAHYNVGYLLNQQGEVGAASAHFVRSLQENPTFEPARLMLDRVIPQVGRRPERRVVDPNKFSAASGATPAAGIQPVQYVTTSQPAVAPARAIEPEVELNALPPIRLPAAAAVHRTQPTTPGFIPPTPNGS